MLNCENIYRVSILDVVFKLNKNYTPYIVLSAETLDENKMRIDACYYFTGRAKYFSYNELIDMDLCQVFRHIFLKDVIDRI